MAKTRTAPQTNGFGDATAPDLFTDHPSGAAPPEAEPHFHNHRARLRTRFLEAGSASLSDYEMLELVLFRAIPRRDVKPLAKRLLARFGDFNGAVSATPARLGEAADFLEGYEDWAEDSLQEALRSWAEDRELGLGKIAQPLRAALTGSNISPSQCTSSGPSAAPITSA